MISYVNELFSDPKGMLMVFLLAFPGRILALSLHEFAHAWVAHRCGDDTAKMLGRLTVNPLRHLDPMGTIMMLVVGFGWAKPVPVNPRNYRSYRRDDLKVSLAGVTMNLLLFVLGLLLMFVLSAVALAGARDTVMGPNFAWWVQEFSFLEGFVALMYFRFGEIARYLATMLAYFVTTNLVLCVFNLLPIPPLDGYHVLNDLVLRRSLFANPRTLQVSSAALLFLVVTGVVGRALGWIDAQVITAAGNAALAGLRALGLLG